VDLDRLVPATGAAEAVGALDVDRLEQRRGPRRPRGPGHLASGHDGDLVPSSMSSTPTVTTRSPVELAVDRGGVVADRRDGDRDLADDPVPHDVHHLTAAAAQQRRGRDHRVGLDPADLDLGGRGQPHPQPDVRRDPAEPDGHRVARPAGDPAGRRQRHVGDHPRSSTPG
jgi:hypothetical protein